MGSMPYQSKCRLNGKILAADASLIRNAAGVGGIWLAQECKHVGELIAKR